jgi:polysaccharide export outer membrane protein
VGSGVFLLSLLLSSCGSKKDIIYFQNIENINPEIMADSAQYAFKIVPNDNLMIMVSSMTPLAVEPFNVINTSRGNSSSNLLELQGYLVDEDGEINFPVIGKIKVGGLTKNEVETLIQEKIAFYVEGLVTVNVRVMNYRISILGEVNRPGMYTVSNEKISLPEALALAGDLTIYGQRHSVQIYRVENGEKRFYTIDLTKPDVFFSPVYYLQQNDIVYVQPNKTKAGSSTYNQNLSLFVSLLSFTFTVVVFFIK